MVKSNQLAVTNCFRYFFSSEQLVRTNPLRRKNNGTD